VSRKPVQDHRPELRVSQQTWDRERRPGTLVDEATRSGWRLVVVRGDGSIWFPDADPNPATW
jgi:hypothetical protein